LIPCSKVMVVFSKLDVFLHVLEEYVRAVLAAISRRCPGCRKEPPRRRSRRRGRT
jgi:hypothetical protein